MQGRGHALISLGLQKSISCHWSHLDCLWRCDYYPKGSTHLAEVLQGAPAPCTLGSELLCENHGYCNVYTDKEPHLSLCSHLGKLTRQTNFRQFAQLPLTWTWPSKLCCTMRPFQVFSNLTLSNCTDPNDERVSLWWVLICSDWSSGLEK